MHSRPLEDWPVCLRDTYPAYITWEEFVQNREVLRSNGYGFGKHGAARRGKAAAAGDRLLRPVWSADVGPVLVLNQA